MVQTLLMERLRGETRLAVMEDGALCEMYIERPGGDDIAGSVYLGRVENVVPGMNAAFVDIGMERNGFLSAGDIQIGDAALSKRLGGLRIEKLVRPGQELLVQVIKAQSGQKGHRLSCHVTLPGRGMVLLPEVGYAGVSRKIADPDERARLQGIARGLTGESGRGVIVRTAAAGMDGEALEKEYRALCAMWEDIETRAAHLTAPRKVCSNDSLTLRCARDMLNGDTDAVWVEGEALYREVLSTVGSLAPRWIDRVKLHKGQAPLFDLHRVDAQLEKALSKYVWLKCGGSLVIEETEAMVVIDVNTGKFTGSGDVEDTLYRLNREAAVEIMRQLRLRDLGGIIVADFIDMASPEHNEGLVELLKDLARRDRDRTTVVGMTGLGLIEITRKKQRRSLSKQLLHTCSDCGGDGRVPSHETTARRAIREIWRRRRMGNEGPLLVETCEPVAGWVRSIGVPEGGRVYGLAVKDMKPGEYTVSPADESRLPDGCKTLK